MKNLFINPTATIREGMKQLEDTAEKCLLVVSENKQLIGTVTDGDIRRGILKGLNFSEEIKSIYCKNPIKILVSNFSKQKAKLILKDNYLSLLPVVNERGIVIDFVTWQKLGIDSQDEKDLSNVPVFIMAGGKGTRLKPFTDILPKPLVPIEKDKTLIEKIISQFTNFGCKDFFISVNYKSKIIKAYFEELNPSYNIHFINEEKPLGTIGSLSLAKNQINSPFFVSNCDILTTVNMHDFLQHHIKGAYSATVAACAKEEQIPYGVCKLADDGSLLKLEEKPKFEFLFNTGLYCFDPLIFDFIPPNIEFDTPCLLEKVIASSSNVGVFPLNFDSWTDYGLKANLIRNSYL